MAGRLGKIFRCASFEADLERYQLRRESCVIKLERIPLDLLFLLLEHGGKLVLREAIVARIWGENVFLDTERSINTAIRKIRKALGDDPHHPQFIETIVGKGYRFIAPLLSNSDGRDPDPETQQAISPVHDSFLGESGEIRLRGFRVETRDGLPVLVCNVVVSNIALGWLPLAELELPADVTLPLKPEDRLLLKLDGVRVTLTDKAKQAIHAFSVSVLQSGLRTRATDFLSVSEQPLEPTSLADADPNAGQLCPQAVGAQERS
jgi:DNA-binding winged helix-turn-helix (wHTH) protein